LSRHLVALCCFYQQLNFFQVPDEEFPFDAKKNIIDPGFILAEITSLRIGAQNRLLNEFQVILGDIEDQINNINKTDNIPQILASNLVQVTFPDNLYVAEVDLDRKIILDNARAQLNFKKRKVSKPLLIKLFLIMQGVEDSNWVYHENKIFTFLEIENDSYFSNVIDIGTVEKIESAYLYESEFIEYQNLFKQLLKNCMKDMLAIRSVNWNKEKKVFYFMPDKEGKENRKESWTGKKTATRTVYELKYQRKNPEKLAHHKHLSFDASFIQVDEHWYGVLNPSWLFTYNLYKKSRFHDDLLSNQKRLEYNQTVRNLVRFIAYFLSTSNVNGDYFINFHNLIEFEYLSPSSQSLSADIEAKIKSGEIN